MPSAGHTVTMQTSAFLLFLLCLTRTSVILTFSWVFGDKASQSLGRQSGWERTWSARYSMWPWGSITGGLYYSGIHQAWVMSDSASQGWAAQWTALQRVYLVIIHLAVIPMMVSEPVISSVPVSPSGKAGRPSLDHVCKTTCPRGGVPYLSISSFYSVVFSYHHFYIPKEI